MKAWPEPILDAVDADVLVSDDADAFKKVSDETGRAHQVCKSHVRRNIDALMAELSALTATGQYHSLETIGVSAEQALAGLGAPENPHSLPPAARTGGIGANVPTRCSSAQACERRAF